MAVSDLVYKQGIKDLASQALTWKTASATSCLVDLVLDSEVPDKDLDTTVSTDVSTATGTTAQTVTPLDHNSATANTVYFPCSQTSWTFTAVPTSQVLGGVVFYHIDTVICLSKFSAGTLTTDGTDVTVTANANGVFKITV